MDADPKRPYAGQILAGKYRIDKIIGEGGMGYILQAFHLELEESLAIKWVKDAETVGPNAIERFLREAKLCAKLKSEHVVRVRDVARTEVGAPFIVMELLDGHDLAVVAKRAGGVPIPLAVDYVIEACEAIAEAHELGIVHRDLKLQNLFLARRKDGSDLVKVLDFGISKVTTSASLAMTSGTAILGSPLYMSPEQWRSSKDVDARSDIWSLGVVLFELLTGTVPFRADSLPELCMQIMSAAPRSIPGLVVGVPPGLEQVVLACLAKDPAGRPPNVGALVRALAPHATARSHPSLTRITRLQPRLPMPSAPESLPTPDVGMRTMTVGTGNPLAGPSTVATSFAGATLPTGPRSAPSWNQSESPALASPPQPGGALRVGPLLAFFFVLAGIGVLGASRAVRPRTIAPPVANASEAPTISASAPPVASAVREEAATPPPPLLPAQSAEAAPAKPKPVIVKPSPVASSYTAPLPPPIATTRDLGGSRR